MKTTQSYIRTGTILLLLCIEFISTKAQTTLVPANTTWKYLSNGSNPGTAWRASTFSDASWPSGAAELGFGDSPATNITSGKSTYYFRKIFTLSNPSQYTGYAIKIRRDDGIIVYINNTEVYRNNMPTGTVNYLTKASTNCSDDGNTTYTVNLASSLFVAGNNIIAAEVHNSSTSSSDITFELRLQANAVPVPCNIPDANTFIADSISINSAKIKWTAVSGILSYNFRFKLLNTSTWTLITNLISPFTYLNNLFPLTTYEYSVQSVCQGGSVSTFSASKTFMTLTNISPLCAIPDASLFIKKNITHNSATIAWTAIPGALSYSAKYRIANSGAVYSNPVNTQNDSIVLTNLQASKNYEFIIQSNCSANMISGYSQTGNFATLPQPVCNIPIVSTFGTSNISSSSTTLSWSAIPGAQSYNVKYRKRSVGASYSSAIPVSTTSFVLNNLVASTNYEFIVQSVCSSTFTSSYSSSGWFSTTAVIIQPPVLGILRGPYMTVAKSDSINIQWRTNINSTSQVRYGTIQNNLTDSVNDTTSAMEHSITLTNLIPNTKYYYSIGPIGSSLQSGINNFFYTAPLSGDPQQVRFWVTGDFGNGSAIQTSVRNSFQNYSAGKTINGWIWLGDNAYVFGSDNDYQVNVFNVYQSQFKNIPLYPSPGNHDYANAGYLSATSLTSNFPYFNIFNLPNSAGTEKYYSTNYGNIHFISLDSYGSYNDSLSAMYNWLKTDLQNNSLQWTIVFMHHPPYSKGSHNSDIEVELVDMRKNIIPLLESFGVDLVLSGHSHNYERSLFIKNHFGVESTFDQALFPTGNIVQTGGSHYSKSTRMGDGTVYVVCGVSGGIGSGSTAGYPHDAMYTSINGVAGSLILESDLSTLTCRLMNTAGTFNDEFTINKTAPIPFRQHSGSSYQESLVPILYPNPTKGDFNFRMNNHNDIPLLITVSDFFGNIIYRDTHIKKTGIDINLRKSETAFSAGMYFVNVSGENINASVRLVIY